MDSMQKDNQSKIRSLSQFDKGTRGTRLLPFDCQSSFLFFLIFLLLERNCLSLGWDLSGRVQNAGYISRLWDLIEQQQQPPDWQGCPSSGAMLGVGSEGGGRWPHPAGGRGIRTFPHYLSPGARRLPVVAECRALSQKTINIVSNTNHLLLLGAGATETRPL